jgi:hypothetical protein
MQVEGREARGDKYRHGGGGGGFFPLFLSLLLATVTVVVKQCQLRYRLDH